MNERTGEQHSGTIGPVSAEPAARKRVLGLLTNSRHPVDAQRVAAELGVHVTTARFHLEQLESAGLVQRRTARENRRGRPRVVYALSASLRAADAREQLIEVLANALVDDARPEAVPRGAVAGSSAAVRAGRRWADAMENADNGAPADGSADRVGELVDVLDSLGFGPEAVDGEILMHDCPFRSAARERPDVVCAVHQGLVERILASGDQASAPASARLLPFVQPDLCVIRLSKPA